MGDEDHAARYARDVKLFISWSGPTSKDVAAALHAWIPRVFHEVTPFMSEDSIESGERWQSVINSELDSTSFGIVCVTSANQEAPWLNFESGALAKKIGDSRVVPVAIDLAPSEIALPLGQFNAVTLDKPGISKLMKSLNNAVETSRPADILSDSIDVWWPRLEADLAAVATEQAPMPEDVRTDRDLLLELVDSVRGLVRTQAAEASARLLRERLDSSLGEFRSGPDWRSLRNATAHGRGAAFVEEFLAQTGDRGAIWSLLADRKRVLDTDADAINEDEARAEHEAEVRQREAERAEAEAIAAEEAERAARQQAEEEGG